MQDYYAENFNVLNICSAQLNKEITSSTLQNMLRV